MNKTEEKKLIKKWNDKAEKQFVGAKVIFVRYMHKEEADDWMWYDQPLALLMEKNGKRFWMYPSADDEGNNGGALFCSGSENEDNFSDFPVMRQR